MRRENTSMRASIVRADALEAVIDGMVQIAKLPFGCSGEHINPFGDGLKMRFETVKALLPPGKCACQAIAP
jgi:hypothetical protein